MIKFSIGTSLKIEDLKIWDSLNKKYQETKIKEVYGSLRQDPVGTSREPERLPDVDLLDLEKFVKEAKKFDINFNYTMNSVLVTPFYLEQNEQKIINFINKLIEIGINRFTVASPYFIIWLKKRFPEVRIYVSTIINVKTIQEARFYDLLGVDRIILSLFANRDFILLQNIRKSVKCELEVLVNEFCNINCWARNFPEHYLIQSFYNRGEKLKNPIEYPYRICLSYMKRCPEHLLYNPFIRPEDVKIYNQLGIEWFKIVGRTWPREVSEKVVKAYMEQSFDGDLGELCPWFYGTKELVKFPKIPNKSLNGFLDYFLKNNPNCYRDCNVSCFYCKEFLKNNENKNKK